MPELVLETKNQDNQTPVIGVAMLTPKLGGDYWAYRVQLSDKQAIVGFPKFRTIGIGFVAEQDWNTNLPYTCGTEEIFKHISHNKGDDAISDEDCRTAIALIQEAVVKDITPEVGALERLARRVRLQERAPGADNSAYLLAVSVEQMLAHEKTARAASA